MNTADRAAAIMVRMGFPESATGPFVSQLRAHILRQCGEGMVNRSGGTWAPEAESLTLEERAKAILAMEWAIDQGHGYRVENFDQRIRNLSDLLTWVRDRLRSASCAARVFWSRKVLRRRNPFASRA